MSNYIRLVDDRWSFRDANTKEFTHCYHTYPAMMIPQVARSLIAEYKPEGELKTIFDPYSGSGTTLVEANLVGVNAVGTDLNPLARLMSRVKTTHYDNKIIADDFALIQAHLMFYNEAMVRNRDFSHISNFSFWYSGVNFVISRTDLMLSSTDIFRNTDASWARYPIPFWARM